jgi:hypothetical protein
MEQISRVTLQNIKRQVDRSRLIISLLVGDFLKTSTQEIMTILKFVESLSAELSPGASVLTDSASDEFMAAHERWSELELKTPGAIVLVSAEEDIVQAVCFQLHII